MWQTTACALKESSRDTALFRTSRIIGYQPPERFAFVRMRLQASAQ
jgi:hypothetical protein